MEQLSLPKTVIVRQAKPNTIFSLAAVFDEPPQGMRRDFLAPGGARTGQQSCNKDIFTSQLPGKAYDRGRQPQKVRRLFSASGKKITGSTGLEQSLPVLDIVLTT